MSGGKQTTTLPRSTPFDRGSPYARREMRTARPPTARAASPRLPPPSCLWSDTKALSRSASPPLTSLADIVPRLAPRPTAPIPIRKRSADHNNLTLDIDMQNRLQKLSSKRDRQKQAKEDDYALDPALVQVAPHQACARCKSQKWKCYILADPNSPRRTCLPCGKNKCTFGGSKTRPATLPHPSSMLDEVMCVQRPRLVHNPSYDQAYHAAANANTGARAQSSGFSDHRSNGGHMHAHPPPLHIRPTSSYPSSSFPTPELSPSALTEGFPSPPLCTPMNGYFFRAPNSPRGLYHPDAHAPESDRGEYRDHAEYSESEDMGMNVDLEFDERPSGSSATSARRDSASPWVSQSVIHLIPSDRLRPIPLPSTEDSRIASAPPPPTIRRSRPSSPIFQRISSPLSTPQASPRHNTHSISVAPRSCPSSPHCPPSPLFPPSPKLPSSRLLPRPDLTYRPLSDTRPISVTSRAPVSSSPGNSMGSSPKTPTLSAFEAHPPTNALLSLLLESVERDPTDPRPILVANDMLGVSDQWVSEIEAARRLGEKGCGSTPQDRERRYDAYRFNGYHVNRRYGESSRSGIFERWEGWRQ